MASSYPDGILTHWFSNHFQYARRSLGSLGLLVAKGSLPDSRGILQTDFGKVSVCQRIGPFDVCGAESGWQT
ncbi:MAG: hypothetical protein R3C53_24090, partial [Pirellulaceae bacterium]